MTKKSEELKCSNCKIIAPTAPTGWHTLIRFTGSAETTQTIILCPKCYERQYGKKQLPTIDVHDASDTIH